MAEIWHEARGAARELDASSTMERRDARQGLGMGCRLPSLFHCTV